MKSDSTVTENITVLVFFPSDNSICLSVFIARGVRRQIFILLPTLFLFGSLLHSYKPIVDYIDTQFENYLQEELKIKRSLFNYHDTRIHICLYFIAPTGHSLKSLDLVTMKKLDSKVRTSATRTYIMLWSFPLYVSNYQPPFHRPQGPCHWDVDIPDLCPERIKLKEWKDDDFITFQEKFTWWSLELFSCFSGNRLNVQTFTVLTHGRQSLSIAVSLLKTHIFNDIMKTKCYNI